MPHPWILKPEGEDESEQLQCMMEVLDTPSSDVLQEATRVKLFFDSQMMPRITANSQGKVHTPGAQQQGLCL